MPAITLRLLRGRIFDMIGDVDSENPAINPFRLDAIINRQANRLASRTIRPQETVQSITLVVGTYDYALASNGIVEHVSQVFLNADGLELYYLPFEQFNQRYRQATAAPAGSGQPREYTVWETADQVMTLRVGPTPDTAGDGPLKVYHSILPVVLSNSVYSFSDSDTIPFSHELLAGLEAACAAEAVLAMSDEFVAKLGLDRSRLVAHWTAEAEGAIRAYNLRQLNNGKRQDRIFRSSGYGHLFGWVR
ncbi:MAG TPA: hypothetical protein VK754_00240 [Propionibacteriaceae bacterium]|nr:hypothetical protein [Propionibacteriaceae bacterium]